MISVNGRVIDLTKFPDGTMSFRCDIYDVSQAAKKQESEIVWKYEGEHECMALWYLSKHLKNYHGDNHDIFLTLHYVPNARMDRVKHDDEVFTLKWFAEFINSLNFAGVYVMDPHSNVTTALIDRVAVDSPKDIIENVLYIMETAGIDPIICYPDEGASKRYSEMIFGDYTFCVKRRDWRTGDIQGTSLMDPEKVKDRNVLIIDDICSRGGTFMHTAKALKEAGAEKIYLYVTHCENTITKGDVLTSGLIEHVFTTDSIFTAEVDEKLMTVYKI